MQPGYDWAMKDTTPLLLDQLELDHTPDAIASRLADGPNHSYLKDFMYGAIDGTITTFAIVAGVAGAGLSPGIVVVLGLANLVGDGFSMAVGNYLGTRSEEERREKLRRIEEDHITRHPEGEREEIRQIFAAKGFDGEDLERVVARITADRRQWVDTMLTEELGVTLENRSPIRAAWTTFIAFALVGAIPLLAFIYQIVVSTGTNLSDPFRISIMLTAATFFGIGALKSHVVNVSWWRGGGETLVMGGIAAALAYSVGAMLRGLI
jgi:VIT1/CCC1 family predicted Fe2+/Mn2+ transporter